MEILVASSITTLVGVVLWKNGSWLYHEHYDVNHIQIPVPDLPKELNGLKIVQLSDIHFNRIQIGITDEFFDQVVTKTNQLKPDMIVLTGDYVIKQPDAIFRLLPFLQKLESKFGTFAVLGNHDQKVPGAKETISKALTSIGITLLNNDFLYINQNGISDGNSGSDLAVVGLGEMIFRDLKPKEVFEKIPEKIPRLVLCHNPDAFNLMKEYRIDIQLSGHTHAGQIRIPRVGPLLKVMKDGVGSVTQFFPKRKNQRSKPKKNYDYWEGYHQIERNKTEKEREDSEKRFNKLYVNRGLASHPPGRLFCNPEITLLELTQQD